MNNNPYDFPRKFRSCLNCIHLRQEMVRIGHGDVGGCFERMGKDGPPNLRKAYCGQWYLAPFDENDL